MAYTWTLRMPGKREVADVRYWVTIEADELSAPIRFYFLATEVAWKNVGFEYGVGPVARDEIGRLDSERDALRPSTFRDFQENFYRYRRIAESVLEANPGKAREAREAILSPRKRRPRVDDAFLRQLSADYRKLSADRGRGATAELAGFHGVSRETVWRWRKKAREAGILERD